MTLLVFLTTGSVPHGFSAMGTGWMYKVEYDGRFRARSVVQGLREQESQITLLAIAPREDSCNPVRTCPRIVPCTAS